MARNYARGKGSKVISWSTLAWYQQMHANYLLHIPTRLTRRTCKEIAVLSTGVRK